MTIHHMRIESAKRSTNGLPTFKVKGWRKSQLAKDTEFLVKDAIWEAVNESEMHVTTNSYNRSVGVIARGCFYLIDNLKAHKWDGLEISKVAVVNSLPTEVKTQMVYMGSWRDFKVSYSDKKIDVITDFEIEPNIWYDCYARDGYVVFVKGE